MSTMMHRRPRPAMARRPAVALAVLAALALAALPAAPAGARPTTLVRSEIPDRYKWNLADIYPDWQAWEQDLDRLEQLMSRFEAYEGTLSQGPENLLAVFKLDDELGMLRDRLSGYAGLSMVTDMRNNEVAAKRQRLQHLLTRFGTATAWFMPELVAIPWETMQAWLDSSPDFAPYRFGIGNLYRQQAHVLDEAQERILATFRPLRGNPSEVFGQLANADIEFPDITLADGDTVTVTSGAYYNLLATDRNQADRERAFDAYYSVYTDKINTYAAIYDGVLQRDWAVAQARHYDSCLESALDDDNIPTAVYENLVATVGAGLEPLHRYYALRKRVLGLESYHAYDDLVPLVDFDRTYPYDEVQEWIIASLAPLGEDYQQLARQAFAGGWLDVYENQGKVSGAFSAGIYGVHPYMLLNYNDTLTSVFTLAHELGHTLHTMLSQETQPFATSDYTIFVAEVASTLNESLLLDYLLAHSTDPAERIALLTHAIDDLVGTFYLQTMFADFELQAHRMVEEGQPITAESLRELYTGLLTRAEGAAVTFDAHYGGTWTRIDHFYEAPFYVYQYATCYASSSEIHKQLTSPDELVRRETLARYLELLRSGGNDYPMAQLARAGVDLTQIAPFQAVIAHFDDLVGRLEAEIGGS